MMNMTAPASNALTLVVADMLIRQIEHEGPEDEAERTRLLLESALRKLTADPSLCVKKREVGI